MNTTLPEMPDTVSASWSIDSESLSTVSPITFKSARDNAQRLGKIVKCKICVKPLWPV